MSKGWISLHREIQNHWLWEDKPYSKGQAWVDLILMANHKPNKFLLGNELIEVDRGQVVTSELKLMDKWGWSKVKVRKFLELLQKDNMIVKSTDKKKTTLTIVNYSDWQDLETTEEPQKDHRETTERPQKDTNNNVNNDNNDNKIILSVDEAEFIGVIEGIKNYPLDRAKDLEMYNRLKEKYPTLDLLTSIKDWANYKLDQPLKAKANPRSQINTSFGKYVEWGKNIKGGKLNATTNGEIAKAPRFDKSKFLANGD